MLVTQQPGSIPTEILSQGDNWFLFHLLSSADLAAIRRANAHFSDDILSSLLNEPIAGQGVFWSSVPNPKTGSSMAYPIALRALSFEAQHRMQDPDANRAPVATFAQTLKAVAKQAWTQGVRAREELDKESALPRTTTVDRPSRTVESQAAYSVQDADMTPTTNGIVADSNQTGPDQDHTVDGADGDYLANLQALAIRAIKHNNPLRSLLESEEGVEWRRVQASISDALPSSVNDKWQTAYGMVPMVLDTLYGPKPNWEMIRPQNGNPRVRSKSR